MLDWTDRHCRYFHRLLSRRTLLYTEMITCGALLYGPSANLLAFDVSEHPIALQLGGSDPLQLAECAKRGEQTGYDSINLNIGCPSNRVQAGRFGACLMAEPELVAECVVAMTAAVTIPVTVKTRIGIDRSDNYDLLCQFIAQVAQAGCKTFIIHARKAWLDGLSPKENREIPPLRYDVVRQIKQDFPQLEIILNGGIAHLEQCFDHLQFVDGVMLGRAIYHNPYFLAEVDQNIYGENYSVVTPYEVIERFLPYVEQQLALRTSLSTLIRPILGLFQGRPGARRWRRYLSENSHHPGVGVEVITTALKNLSDTAAI